MINNYYDQNERKRELIWSGDYYEFHTTLDLGNRVILVPINPNEITECQRLMDVASFLAYWFTNIYKHLNGYQGIDCVEWKILTGNPEWANIDPKYKFNGEAGSDESHMQFRYKIDDEALGFS